jgi:hypothetical protein
MASPGRMAQRVWTMSANDPASAPATPRRRRRSSEWLQLSELVTREDRDATAPILEEIFRRRFERMVGLIDRGVEWLTILAAARGGRVDACAALAIQRWQVGRWRVGRDEDQPASEVAHAIEAVEQLLGALRLAASPQPGPSGRAAWTHGGGALLEELAPREREVLAAIRRGAGAAVDTALAQYWSFSQVTVEEVTAFHRELVAAIEELHGRATLRKLLEELARRSSVTDRQTPPFDPAP